MRRSTRNFNIPPPPGQTPGIWTFEDWIVQIPAPSGQNGVPMPHLIVGFVCQMPLLKNNGRWLLSSLIKLVYKHANTCFGYVDCLSGSEGILQFKPKRRFFIRQCFFFFHCSLLFYGYSKNLCRHKRGTKPQLDSLYKKIYIVYFKKRTRNTC